MEKIVHIAKDFQEADEWDIHQHINMTPEERQHAARELKLRYYGPDTPDVREDRTVRVYCMECELDKRGT